MNWTLNNMPPGFWAVLAVLLALPGAAQECRPLDGTWRMNRAKSFFAGLKNPGEQAEDETLAIKDAGGKIQEIWSFEGSRIHDRVAYAYIVDGGEHSVGKGPLIPSSVRAEWQNCTLIVYKEMPFLGGLKFKVRNTYVLSGDGKELTILQEAHNVLADVERRLVFDRQEMYPRKQSDIIPLQGVVCLTAIHRCFHNVAGSPRRRRIGPPFEIS